MSSISNDIVALDHINVHRTIQKRFYSKILTADEVSLFSNNDFDIPFDNFVWLCWSIKESVYKLIKRHQPEANFSPNKIIVTKIKKPQKQNCINAEKHEGIAFQDKECFCCEALCDKQHYFTRSLVNNHFIFTVANNKDCFINVFWGVQNIDNDSYALQTQIVRTFTLERLQQQFKNEDLQIQKAEAGFPFIVPYHNIPLSFTHHGNFVGYSFEFEEKFNCAVLSTV